MKQLAKPPIWKRGFDLLATSAVLLVIWPLMLIIAACVKAILGSPVLFRQQRPGIGGRAFTLLKFRTMRNDGGANDRERMTRFGRFLRETSLDELPELWNVVRGEMSLVGPRPLLMQYLDRYSADERRRHDVLPGITGWAQVNGRNGISWNARFALDVWYVQHQSFWLDMKILLLTIWRVLSREGISQPEHVTMPEFTRRENEGVQ